MPAPPMMPDEFADRWKLDEGSRALLRGLEPDIQDAVTFDMALSPSGRRRNI